MHISHWLLHTEEFSSENASAGCPRKMHYGRISQPLDGKGTEQATSNGNECCSRLFEPEFSLPPAPSFIPASPRPHFEQFYGIQMDSVARNGQKTKPKGKALRYRFMQSPQNQFNIRRGLICNRLLTAEISPSPTREWGRVGGAVGNSEGRVRCRNKQPNENEAEVIFRWRCSKHNHIKKKKKGGGLAKMFIKPLFHRTGLGVSCGARSFVRFGLPSYYFAFPSLF